MFGPSYSSKSMILTVNILKELDERIEEDFDKFPPAGIPRDHEWQMLGLGDIFLILKRKKRWPAMEKAVHFD